MTHLIHAWCSSNLCQLCSERKISWIYLWRASASLLLYTGERSVWAAGRPWSLFLWNRMTNSRTAILCDVTIQSIMHFTGTDTRRCLPRHVPRERVSEIGVCSSWRGRGRPGFHGMQLPRTHRVRKTHRGAATSWWELRTQKVVSSRSVCEQQLFAGTPSRI